MDESSSPPMETVPPYPRFLPIKIDAMVDFPQPLSPTLSLIHIYTPPCYTIYMAMLVLEWLKNEIGGLEAMQKINEKKAGILYDFLDHSSLFKGTVVPKDRSLMNIPFITGNQDLDAKFVKESTAAGFVNLKGHRTVGGMRASVYNAMPVEGVEKLVAFMKQFEADNA